MEENQIKREKNEG